MKRRLWLVSGVLLLFQWYARFGAAPVVDFVLDDWALLVRAESMATYQDAWRMLAQEPDRPVGAFLLATLFRAFGDRLLLYQVLSYLVHSVGLLALIGIVWLLVRDLTAVMVAGALFAVLPNLTESFNWTTMICFGPGIVAYPLSALFWIRYAQAGGRINLAISALLFAMGLGTYEFGIALPAVYLLIWRKPWRSGLISLIPFAAVIAVYLAWRFSGGFGLASGVLFAPRTPSISVRGLIANAADIASWWFGGKMFDAFRNGLDGFAQMDLWPRRLFLGGMPSP